MQLQNTANSNTGTNPLLMNNTNLNNTASDDQFLSVDEFGDAMLRGMGWSEGKPIGRNQTKYEISFFFKRSFYNIIY